MDRHFRFCKADSKVSPWPGIVHRKIGMESPEAQTLPRLPSPLPSISAICDGESNTL